MIEVVLAMGVIALAMTSVLALLPVGLNASRDAVNLNYSTDATANFLGRIKNWIQTVDTGTGKYRYSAYVKAMSMYLPGDPDFSTYAPSSPAPPSLADINTYSTEFATALRNGKFSVIDGSGPTPPTDWSMLEEGLYKNSNLANCYFVVQGKFDSGGNPLWVKNKTSGAGKAAVDLSAMVYLWRSPPLTSYDDSGWKSWPVYSDNFKYFTAINVEISWPLVNYLNRERCYYSLELTNPNATEY